MGEIPYAAAWLRAVERNVLATAQPQLSLAVHDLHIYVVNFFKFKRATKFFKPLNLYMRINICIRNRRFAELQN